MFETLREIRGLEISRGCPGINHLLFVDNYIIFCRASIKEWQKVSLLLNQYELASGQTLNKQKACIFFSNTKREEIKHILQLSGAKRNGTSEKYIGLPSMVGTSKYYYFRGLNERVWNKVHSWKNQLLSQAGKEILIKAIIHSIPTYSMSVFKLSKRL